MEFWLGGGSRGISMMQLGKSPKECRFRLPLLWGGGTTQFSQVSLGTKSSCPGLSWSNPRGRRFPGVHFNRDGPIPGFKFSVLKGCPVLIVRTESSWVLKRCLPKALIQSKKGLHPPWLWFWPHGLESLGVNAACFTKDLRRIGAYDKILCFLLPSPSQQLDGNSGF